MYRGQARLMMRNARINGWTTTETQGVRIDAYQDPLCVTDSPGEVANVSIRANNLRGKFDAEPGSRLVSIIGG